MDIVEYQKVKNMTYLEYCDYLQQKYGIGLADYMTKSYRKNKKCTRTNEGLIAHHKAEDKMIMLSTVEYAKACPFEWQKKENIIYCDYLEHLLLHVLICKYPSPDKIPMAVVGFGGVVNFFVPELNDIYSGFITKQAWRKNCHDKVINDKNVYFAILKDFVEFYKIGNKPLPINFLLSSYNEDYGLWDKSKNEQIFNEIKNLYYDVLCQDYNDDKKDKIYEKIRWNLRYVQHGDGFNHKSKIIDVYKYLCKHPEYYYIAKELDYTDEITDLLDDIHAAIENQKSFNDVIDGWK